MGESVPSSSSTTTAAAIGRRFEPAIPVALIARNPRNHRKHFDQAALAELAESILADGLLQPIVVVEGTCRDPEDDPAGVPTRAYQLLMGERRLRAARLAGIEALPAMVFSGVSTERALALALVENLQRESLNAMEEAEGFGDLSGLGWSQQQIADQVHKSRARISNALRLLELPEAIKDHVRTGLLTQKHAEGILRFKDYPKVLVAIADLAVKRAAPAAELARGIPFAIDLQRAGVIKALDYEDLAPAGLDYDAAGTLKALKALPFTRVEKGANTWENDTVYVLDLPAWEEWLQPQIEAFEERNRKAAADAQRELERQRKKSAPAAEAAASPDAAESEEEAPAKGPKLVDLEKLGYGKYKLLSDLEAGVRRQIPPEKIELGTVSWSHAPGWKKGEPVKFTRDVALCEKLQRAAATAKNKVQREKLDVAYECAVANVKAINYVSSDDLAQVADWALQFGTDIDGAFAELGIEPTEELHKLKPLEILQLVILARVRGVYAAARRDATALPEDLEIYAGKKWEAEYKRRVHQAEKEEAKKKAAAKTEDGGRKTEDGTKPPAKKAAKKKAGMRKGTRVEITPALRESILDAIKEGGTGAAIAKRFGVSLPTVQNIKRAAGLTRTADKAAAR
jgi:ParB/RepB/Spo0J family partition protein